MNLSRADFSPLYPTITQTASTTRHGYGWFSKRAQESIHYYCTINVQRVISSQCCCMVCPFEVEWCDWWRCTWLAENLSSASHFRSPINITRKARQWATKRTRGKFDNTIIILMQRKRSSLFLIGDPWCIHSRCIAGMHLLPRHCSPIVMFIVFYFFQSCWQKHSATRERHRRHHV